MKTLYLHIGMPKTATSSIQKFLRTNRSALKAHGYGFPKPLTRYPATDVGRNAHFLIGKLYREDGTRDLEAEAQVFSSGMDQLHAYLEKFDQVILSDESLWRCSTHRNQAPFQRLAEDALNRQYRIRLIVYLRRQDQFLISRWNQAVKYTQMETLSLPEYMNTIMRKEKRLYDYAGTLKQLADIFGRENLIVRRFDASDWKDGSIIADFLDCVGLSLTPDFSFPEMSANHGLKGNTCEIKRLLNKNEGFSLEEKNYLGAFLRELSDDSGRRYPCAMLSAQETAELLHAYEEGNAEAAAEYIGDGKPLFSGEISELPKWEPDNPYMMEDVIRFFSSVCMDLYRRNNELAAECQAQRMELDAIKQNLSQFKSRFKHPSRTLLEYLRHKEPTP